MRNKGFFWGVTIVLVLACVYQLSFTWATSSVEKDAEEYASEMLDSLNSFEVPYMVVSGDTLNVSESKDSSEIVQYFVDQYLKEKANQVVFLGYTYAECQEKEINLGLDLKGGMSVTLEISIPELVKSLAGNTRNPEFVQAYDVALERYNLGEGNFIDLFEEEYKIASPDGSLAKIYHTRNSEYVEIDASNEEVIGFLKNQANSALDGVEIIIEKRVNTFGVAQPTIQKQTGSNRIFVELPGVKDVATVRRKLQTTANLEFYEVYDNKFDGISQGIMYAEAILSEALFGDDLEKYNDEEDTDTTASDPFELTADGDTTNTADASETDTSEVDPLLAGSEEKDEFLQEAEGDSLDTQEEMSTEESRMRFPIRSYLTLYMTFDETSGQPEYFEGSVVGQAFIKDTSILNSRLKHPAFRSIFPEDLKFMWAAKESVDQQTGVKNGIVVLHAIKVPRDGAQVDGEHIAKSYVGSNGLEITVNMQMTNRGAQAWEEMTSANVGKQVAITMDNYVFSAPVVNEVMSNSSQISGGFSIAEATDLSGLLNAGALPAPVKIVDESVVGATLGADNVTSGMYSFIAALMVVLLYMMFYYSKAGAIADLALVINIFLLFGTLASLGAILTLPGIAGIVLTIGMSVDANVLIFERVREEIRNGKGLKSAINDGYQKALSSILDANITTLLTGIVLVTFGTGPIKGFATTLIIGIFTSFFAALVITRLIISMFLDRDKTVSFSSKITENWFVNTAVPFVKKRKLFYIISGVLILIGVSSILTRGLDLGVDFQGGRQYKVEFSEPVDQNKIVSNLTAQFDGNAPQVKTVDNDFTALITTKYLITKDSSDALLDSLLKVGLSDVGYKSTIESKKIAPTISKDLKENSFYAIGFSLLIIFLYILIRFRKWQFGLGALIAMAHDVLIVLALFSLFWGILPFSMEIDQAFIAAILTVVGYSINDTVVVFDRIREFLGIHTKKDQKDVINMALNSTMSRTINTSVSTFIVLLVIFMFGGEAIKGFTFALMIGVVVGTYSSLFIATPAVIDFSKKKPAVKEVK